MEIKEVWIVERSREGARNGVVYHLKCRAVLSFRSCTARGKRLWPISPPRRRLSRKVPSPVLGLVELCGRGLRSSTLWRRSICCDPRISNEARTATTWNGKLLLKTGSTLELMISTIL
ncbi:hypothetical protein HNY73_006105 [Argiope bruennichi]|uniref:Uncharacterized protein n=1 Tax=Argiope bruennichi TaxID=94029 RepID=A0A8T0FJK6_ARGBR|nr:hypothetical protein HNY73_006105 [Argiope bruennichi]